MIPRLMKFVLAGLALPLSLFMAFDCGPLGCGRPCIEISSDFECIQRPDDPTGYLQPICQFMVEKLSCYELDPNKIEIVEIVPGSEEQRGGPGGPISQYTTDDFDFVLLNCCYSGDRAIMHVASKTCVQFILGPV